MAEYTPLVMPPALPELSRKASIVGIGESDYHADYRNQRKPPPALRTLIAHLIRHKKLLKPTTASRPSRFDPASITRHHLSTR